MESQIGLYKTELIKPRRPWHGPADVELGTGRTGSTGSTTSVSVPPSGPSRPTNTRPTTTLNTSPNRRLESTHRASTEPGALQRAAWRFTAEKVAEIPRAPLAESDGLLEFGGRGDSCP